MKTYAQSVAEPTETERSVVQGAGLLESMTQGGNSVMYTGLDGMKNFHLAMEGYINSLEEKKLKTL